MYHTETFGTQVTSLKIGIASQVSDGRHSLVVIAVAVYSKISLLLMSMQVRSFCLLEILS